jgi:hypothetical protein
VREQEAPFIMKLSTENEMNGLYRVSDYIEYLEESDLLGSIIQDEDGFFKFSPSLVNELENYSNEYLSFYRRDEAKKQLKLKSEEYILNCIAREIGITNKYSVGSRVIDLANVVNVEISISVEGEETSFMLESSSEIFATSSTLKILPNSYIDLLLNRESPLYNVYFEEEYNIASAMESVLDQISLLIKIGSFSEDHIKHRIKSITNRNRVLAA